METTIRGFDRDRGTAVASISGIMFETLRCPSLVCAFLLGGCLAATAALAQVKNSPSGQTPAGVWRGESVCATAATSCHDEKVVYHIEATGKPDAVFIKADKIVNGQATTMGSGPWQYDRDKHALRLETAGRVWLLNVHDRHIEGTLTMPDSVIFRRMRLTRDE